MQQIELIDRNKKVPDYQHLFICNNVMVRVVDSRWNQLYLDLVLIHEKVVRFGLVISVSPRSCITDDIIVL
jgi:hypothetical protein